MGKMRFGADFTEEQLQRKVVRLAESFEDDEIAEIIGLPLSAIRLMTREARGFSKWWVLDCKTGRSFFARSQRGAYRIVCLRGLTDWDWGTGSLPVGASK